MDKKSTDTAGNGGGKNNKILLRGWLAIVGVMRVTGIFLMWFQPEFYRKSIYSLAPEQGTDMMLRLSGVWTSMSLVLCLLSAYDIHNAPIKFATLFSFLGAAGHFASEIFVFKTALLLNTSSTFLFAVPSILWLTADLLFDHRHQGAVVQKKNKSM